MKDKKFSKKLHLKKITVSHLNDELMKEILGGVGVSNNQGGDKILTSTPASECPGCVLD